jgi:hypothetical protein
MQRGLSCGFVTTKPDSLRSMSGLIENNNSRQEIIGSSPTPEVRQETEAADDSCAILLLSVSSHSDGLGTPSRSRLTCFCALHSALFAPVRGFAVTGNGGSMPAKQLDCWTAGKFCMMLWGAGEAMSAPARDWQG